MIRLVMPVPLVALLLAGCDSAASDAPPAASVEEAQAIEEAASMLDEQRLETEVAPENDEPELPEEE